MTTSSTTALLSSAYFGPIQWYQKLNRYPVVLIEQHDSYQKQTYRNRCVIATTNGTQTLTVPVIRSEERRAKCEGINGRDAVNDEAAPFNSSLSTPVRVSDHGNWRHLHWHALMSAYGESPFFEYYADDLRPFFERRWERLYDFNMAICRKMCELLDIHPDIRLTDEYIKPSATNPHPSTFPHQPSTLHLPPSPILTDFREAIDPKHPQPDPDFTPRRYYQVYERKHGFLPNLSILDLLFNMGPESIFYL